MTSENSEIGDEGGTILLRDRMNAAVGDIYPDLAALMLSGTESGRRTITRRRRIAAGSAAAAVLLVTGGITYGANTDWLGSKTPPADGSVNQIEPATPRGFAAALMAHTDGLGTLVGVGADSSGHEAQPTGLSAEIAYELGDGVKVDLNFYAVKEFDAAEQPCTEPGGVSRFTCEEFTLDGGVTGAFYVYEVGEPATSQPKNQSSAIGVLLVRADGSVGVVETVVGSQRPVLDREALITILSDPTVGLSTTAALNAAGERIEGFDEDGFLGTSDSDSSSGSASPPSEAPNDSGGSQQPKR